MTDIQRREEYLSKGKELYDSYMSEYMEFMKRRRSYRKFDEGVREENEIRKRYNDKVTALAEEYKDVAIEQFE